MAASEVTARAGYVARSRFEVRPGWEDAVVQAFRDRPRLVEDAPGFLRLDVVRPTDNPREFWLLTYWEDAASFERWHREHRTESHAGIPEGLRLVPGSARVDAMEHVTS